MKITYVIFDLDGTLLNTIDDIGSSVNRSLKKLGLKEYSIEDYKNLVGNGADILIRKALGELCEDEKLACDCLNEFNLQYEKNWNNLTKPYPGILKLLDSLEHFGIKLGVLSNKPDAFTQIMVRHFFGPEKFECVFGARDGFPKKPDPFSVLQMIHILGEGKKDCLYIGDSDVDMITAKNAGLVSVGVTWGFRTRKELIANGADYLADKPEDIMSIIKRLTV